MMQGYKNRQEAGKILADKLKHLKGRSGLLVLGLPRGGVVVAEAVASELEAELDVLLVRKLGIPGHEEVAMGAIATGGAEYLNQDIINQLYISDEHLEMVRQKETAELKRRETEFRGDRNIYSVEGRTVIIVDDGIATGATIQVAESALRKRGPGRIVIAVPVAPPSVIMTLKQQADEVVCPLAPESFRAVGQWYQDFAQTTDTEVRRILRRNWHVN